MKKVLILSGSPRKDANTDRMLRYALEAAEGVGDIGVTAIRERIARHIDMTGKTPLVIVDYLQIVAPYNERATDKQNMDKAVLELKRISRDFKLPVIAVSRLSPPPWRARRRSAWWAAAWAAPSLCPLPRRSRKPARSSIPATC